MTQPKKSKALRSIDPRELRSVSGGVLYPAVKLTDMVIGGPMSAQSVYLKFEGISGDATE